MRTVFTTAAIATAIAGVMVAAAPAAAQPYRHDHGWHHGYDRPHHDARWRHHDWRPHHRYHGYYGRHR